MSRRRVFDIDFPEEPSEQGQAEVARKGPMAAAISENADAVRDRAETAASIRAENDRLAHEHVRLRRLGLITDRLPLDAIRTDKLKRDRGATFDPDLDELISSIRDVGLSNPIRVEIAPDGTYELIQGYRRLSAFRALLEDTGEETWATIPAAISAEGDALPTLYRRMIDENMVRRDISFAEMGLLALAYVEDPRTETSDIADAVAALFASAGRQKRNYIGRFARLMAQVGDFIQFPEDIPRALGLDLEKRLSERAFAPKDLSGYLKAKSPESGAVEVQVLRDFIRNLDRAAKTNQKGASAKTTLKFQSSAFGSVRCLLTDGKLEIRANRDFSRFDRECAEEAVKQLLDRLDQARSE